MKRNGLNNSGEQSSMVDIASQETPILSDAIELSTADRAFGTIITRLAFAAEKQQVIESEHPDAVDTYIAWYNDCVEKGSVVFGEEDIEIIKSVSGANRKEGTFAAEARHPATMVSVYLARSEDPQKIETLLKDTVQKHFDDMRAFRARVASNESLGENSEEMTREWLRKVFTESVEKRMSKSKF